jgi:valyl-tRNA synthetase
LKAEGINSAKNFLLMLGTGRRNMEVILEQLKKLGASCDWERTKFTMDPDMSASVIHSFVDLYNKGLIYRGYRMVNWDQKLKLLYQTR